MKFRYSGILWFLLVFVSPAQAQEPVFRLRDLDNQWKEYEELKGSSLTILDFWATWCQPCLRSIPHLIEMSQEYSDRGVAFIGISVDGTRNQSKIRPFVESMGVEYPILRDIDSELMSDLGVTAVPTLLVYNAEGELVYFHEGYRPGDESVIRKEIESQLKN